MLTNGTKRRIDTARDILVGKLPDPKSQVEQITIALIYKFMDDMDKQSEELGGKAKFFTGEYAKYAWIQHFLYHLSPSGQAGFVLAKGSLTSKTSGEGGIRKELIEARLVDCIVNLPAKLFLNTQIPASLWFLSRNKANGKFRNRTNEILFIDARNMGHLINRRTREFSAEDIMKIANTYRMWKSSPSSNSSQRVEDKNPSTSGRGGGDDGFSPPGRDGREGVYQDIKGFCNSASIERVMELDYVLTPGRYVGLPDEDDDFDFNEPVYQAESRV